MCREIARMHRRGDECKYEAGFTDTDYQLGGFIFRLVHSSYKKYTFECDGKVNFKHSQKKYCNQLISPNSTLQNYYLESKYKGMTATILAMAASGYPKSKYILHTVPLANSEIHKMQIILTVITTILYDVHKLHISH